MSTSELEAVESLLMQVLPDPMGFAERVLGELLERLATPTGVPTVVPGQAFPAAGPFAGPAQRSTRLLAAALGACDCWGEDRGCATCEGHGSPGWVPPDPELFAEYVAPAVRRTSSTDHPDHQSDEGEDTHE